MPCLYTTPYPVKVSSTCLFLTPSIIWSISPWLTPYFPSPKSSYCLQNPSTTVDTHTYMLFTHGNRLTLRVCHQTVFWLNLPPLPPSCLQIWWRHGVVENAQSAPVIGRSKEGVGSFKYRQSTLVKTSLPCFPPPHPPLQSIPLRSQERELGHKLDDPQVACFTFRNKC